MRPKTTGEGRAGEVGTIYQSEEWFVLTTLGVTRKDVAREQRTQNGQMVISRSYGLVEMGPSWSHGETPENCHPMASHLLVVGWCP